MGQVTSILFQKTRKFYYVTVVCIFFISSTTSKACNTPTKVSSTKLFDTTNSSLFYDNSKNKNFKGTVLVIHGLNLIPMAMNDLSLELINRGYSVYRLALTGSLKNQANLKNDNIINNWKKDIYCAFELMTVEFKRTNKPIKTISQSLGSLITFWKLTDSKMRFHKHVFLAPAIKVKWLFSLHQGLFFLSGDTKIPSKNLKEYSSFDFTSLGEYRSVKLLHKNIEDNLSYKTNSRITVFLNKEDELIHYKDSISFFNRLGSSVKTITKSPSSIGHQHLFVDYKTAGNANISQFIEALE